MEKGFETYLQEHGRSQRTVEAYLNDVRRFVKWSEGEYQEAWSVSMLNRADLREYQMYCREKLQLKAATWNRSVASLAVLADWLKSSGQIDHDPVGEALTRASMQALAPRSLRKFEHKKLRLYVSECVRTAKTETGRHWALRNAALVACLWWGGMREGEVAHLRKEQVLLGERSGRIEVINAKGNKDRVIPLNYEALLAIRGWMDVRGAGELVFCGIRGEGLSERGIQKIVGKLAAGAGIGHVSPHQLRHTAGHTMVSKGADLGAVAAFLGHASLEGTRRYTLPHYDELEALVETL